MANLFRRFSQWLQRSISKEGIVLTEDTQKLVDWLAKVQRRPVEAVVNDLLAAELEQQRRNEAGMPHWSRLTPREQEVAVLIIQGYSNPQIARTLDIELETVRSHILHIKSKYGVQGKTRLRQRLLADRFVPVQDQPDLTLPEPPEDD